MSLEPTKHNEAVSFDDLNFVPYNNGIAARILYPNGFGASIVRNIYSYGHERGKYELAVINSNGDICYDTEITNDVIGYLIPADITVLLGNIFRLNSEGTSV